MTAPEFRELGEVSYGVAEQVTPLVRRVIAENPSKYTYKGTGTYIVGHGDVVVIDPGPVLDSHRSAIAAAVHGERVRAILVTHCHADHSPLAAWLKAETGAPTIAFGPHGIVSDDPDDALHAADDDGEADDDDGERTDEAVKVEESVDVDFVPDQTATDGDIVVDWGGLTMTAVFTPGHTSNHMCYSLAQESTLFTGDHVMGWSTTVVSPPDGNMADYIKSLRKVAARGDSVLWPTHGPSRTDGPQYLDALIEHRLERERQILDAVRGGTGEIGDIVELLYAHVREELHKPAGRSVFGHLVKLVDEGIVATADGGRARLKSHFVATGR